MAQAFAAVSPTDGAADSTVPDTRPLFESIFKDRVGSAVSPAVSSLWSPTGAAAAPPASGRPLDLFTDTKPNLRGMFGAS